MEIAVSKYFNDIEYSLILKRQATNFTFIELLKNNESYNPPKEVDTQILLEKGRNYNSGLCYNDREPFEQLFIGGDAFIKENDIGHFRELIRILGITNGLCHYFVNLSSMASTKKFITECFENNVSGFIFINWNEIEGDEPKNQLLYISPDNLDSINISTKSLESAYARGEIGKIRLSISETETFTRYSFTSIDIDSNLSDPVLRKTIISIVNADLIRKFK